MINKKLVIYFDMDGVLADFGRESNAVERFATESGFFYNLKPLRKNVLFIRDLINKGYKVNILSASPNITADNDKIEWLKKYVPQLKKENIILCRNHEVKSDFVVDIENSLLIDDYTVNLMDWKSKGGKVVKFLNSYDNKKGKHTEFNIKYVKNLKKLM